MEAVMTEDVDEERQKAIRPFLFGDDIQERGRQRNMKEGLQMESKI